MQRRFARGSLDALAEARAAGADAVSLQTCFLAPPSEVVVGELLEEAGALELALSWGAPNGLAFGADERAADDLLGWIAVAPELAVGVVRVVAGGPSLREVASTGDQLARTVAPLALAAKRAGDTGIQLALENHGELTAAEICDLVDRVDDPALGVCFDTANALRVGDDVLGALELLAPLVRMVHLKDCEPLDTVRDPVAGPRSVPFGEGAIPVTDVLDRLREAAFTGLVCVELGQVAPDADELALVRASVRWLRRALRAPSEIDLPPVASHS